MSEADEQGDNADEREISAEEIRSALVWAREATGESFTAYLFALTTDEVPAFISGGAQFYAPRLQVAAALAMLRANLTSQFDESNMAELLRVWLCQIDTSGHPIAVSLRRLIEPLEDTVAANDEIENTLAALARDVYPALLLPPPPNEIDNPYFKRSPRLTTLSLQLPGRKTFEQAVLRDSKLRKIFGDDIPGSGRVARIVGRSGSGGGLQLMMLAEILISDAWRHLRDGERSQEGFVEAALREVRLMRGLVKGETHNIPARVAFAGVLLPPGESMIIPNGIVRATNSTDRDRAPSELKHQLVGTDSSGVSTTINYDGDIILDYDYPYTIKASPWSADVDTTPWPAEYQMPEPGLEQTILRLRFALMLAVNRPDYRAQLVSTWRVYDVPLTAGSSMSWSDPRQGTGIMPTQLTEDELKTWKEWFDRLSTAPVARIELALSRILKAIAERREPSDVLVDSVIAWENLFGTKDGEPVFRVTTSLAVLLEETLEARKQLKTALGKIYTLRSNVVHGSKNLVPGDYPQCQDALEIAIRAIRTLAMTRTDILALPDGSARSAELLMGTSAEDADAE